MPIILRNWLVRTNGGDDGYTPPELLSTSLVGDVENHPRLNKGPGSIQSSQIVASEGRLVTTKSGSVYQLEGPPNQRWAAWLKEMNIPLDLDNPVKVRSGK